MHYLGGKERIAKHICEYLESVRKPGQVFTDLTVGGLSIIARMQKPKKGYDIHDELVYFYQYLSHNPEMLEKLPEEIDEYQFKQVKDSLYEECWYRPFVEFGCTFGGKGFSDGYARTNAKNPNGYAIGAKNSLRRKFKDLYGVEFKHQDLFDYEAKGELIYIDPPYQGTTKYNAVKPFNYKGFWDKVRELSKDNDVYVSEYEAPEDFECVWSKEKKLGLRTKDGKQPVRIEKIFKIKGQNPSKV